jgi:TPR repeat protein
VKTLQIHDVIDENYEVIGFLGKGGMGQVVAARHRKLGGLVALKFLLHETPAAVARFYQEARTISSVKNAHVAAVHDLRTFDGVPFIVMEHLTGQDLAAILRQRGSLPITEAVDLVLQVCDAIHEAHTLGIVHRDIKPANLFLTTTREGAPLVKVLDFGISKSNASEDLSMTATAVPMGSPLYMSPEQHSSARSADARADVWALGVVLYELLAGKTPFTGENAPEVRAAIARGVYAPLSNGRSDVPAVLEQILSEALRTDRDLRTPSVKAFAARLAPLGSDSARTSYASIERVGASAPPARPDARYESPAPASGGEVTSTGRLTGTAVTKGEPQAAPRRRPWAARVAVASVGAFVVLGSVEWRQAHVADSSKASSTPARPTASASGSSERESCAEGATVECETACAAHQAGACNELARALEKGTGAEKNLARAATLYDGECASGVLVACNSLGALYARGDGVARDATKAIGLYKNACDHNYGRACMNLGAMYFEGDGVPMNETLGADLFLSACNAGEPLGCANLATAYAQGRGVAKNADKALTFAERACANGAGAGCARVALAKITGEGAAKDVKAGLEELEAMCTKGEAAGCERLESIYAKGVGADVAADPLLFRDYAKRACALGSRSGCDAEQAFRASNSSNAVAGQANALLQTSCDAGNLAACGMLGENLIKGNGASADREKGTALRAKACKGGVRQACGKLAEGPHR